MEVDQTDVKQSAHNEVGLEAAIGQLLDEDVIHEEPSVPLEVSVALCHRRLSGGATIEYANGLRSTTELYDGHAQCMMANVGPGVCLKMMKALEEFWRVSPTKRFVNVDHDVTTQRA